ncbi:unnamed protein product [Mucor hiemalis]
MESFKLVHGPAQKVGQMRVSRSTRKRQDSGEQSNKIQSDCNIVSVHDNVVSLNNGVTTDVLNSPFTTVDEEELSETKENNEEGAKTDLYEAREFQERYARDLLAHSASRELNVTANPGTNVKRIRNSNPQQRGWSH